MINTSNPPSSEPIIRLAFSIQLNYEIGQLSSDFIFSIHAAKTSYQIISNEYLNTSQNVELILYEDPVRYTRLLRLKALPGDLRLNYSGVVDLTHFTASPNQIYESAVADLPGSP
jgi:hypothetical protein